MNLNRWISKLGFVIVTRKRWKQKCDEANHIHGARVHIAKLDHTIARQDADLKRLHQRLRDIRQLMGAKPQERTLTAAARIFGATPYVTAALRLQYEKFQALGEPESCPHMLAAKSALDKAEKIGL